ncbi:MAG TPA: HAMP domain-containing sensor histidine kinase [Opitutaceae bacterium]|nr:HAMP domain-containing sensor histidine kinase [Opitutaceae bacterium]
MSNESLLQWPISLSNGKVMSQWLSPWSSRGLDGTSIREDRNAIIAIQWLVAIGTSYLVFAAHDWSLTDPLPALLILMCLGSASLLKRVSEETFKNRLIEPGLLILDSILIVSAILTQEAPWDLLLLFFFCVLIAAIGENLIQIGVGCVLLSLVFLVFVSPNAADVLTINPNFFIRVPFMFGISIFYGHLTSQVKREKRRVEKMEATTRLKRQFVCALAHDIKTPLNVILGHAELLAGDYGSQPDSTEKLSSITCIRKNIEGIVKLITDFLAVSKLEAFVLDSAKNLVQLNVIAEDVVLEQMVTARDNHLNLTLDLDEKLKPMLGDSNQMQRALGNLVGNAIKFTPPGGSITVTSRMVKNDISIKVTDTGSGIPTEELSGLFSEFKRLKGTANIEGTGLGLFIVKTIVEAHNGTVAVESKEGVGTTFTMLLPASQDLLGGVQPENANKGAETRISIERDLVRQGVEEQARLQ